MRVPIRSAGTRSGVNWMRRKTPRSVRASVFTVSVLARPGTPSTSRCPCASMATSTRSRKWSWPTTVFFTSYSTRSIGETLLIGFSLKRGQARGASAELDRHGECDARKARLVPRAEDGGDDADHFAGGVDERPARAAGIRRRVELDEVGEPSLSIGRLVLA